MRVVLAALALVACAPTAPVETTVCALVADHAAFDGKTVRVRAQFTGNGLIGALTDPACPGAAVDWFDGKPFLGSPEARAFSEASMDLPADNAFAVDLTGRFSWRAAREGAVPQRPGRVTVAALHAYKPARAAAP